MVAEPRAMVPSTVRIEVPFLQATQQKTAEPVQVLTPPDPIYNPAYARYDKNLSGSMKFRPIRSHKYWWDTQKQIIAMDLKNLRIATRKSYKIYHIPYIWLYNYN